MSDVHWFKSDASGDHGCVEVAFSDGKALVRDTKDHGTGPVLTFEQHEWEAFMIGARNGEFDLPR